MSINVSSTASPSSTVLLAWELGGGLGHVATLLRLAEGLAARGYRPVLAVRNLVEPWPVLRSAPYPVMQAPLWQPRADSRDESGLAASYADILAIRGFRTADDLLPMVQGWQGLLDVVQPAFIIGDHCPTLCVAAYLSVPMVLVGCGFVMPPIDEATFPLLLPHENLLAPEIELLETIQEVQRRRQRPSPATLPGLFASPERFVTVLPELDPYKNLRKEPQIGPLEPRLSVPLPPPARAEFFAYLSEECPGLDKLMTGLAHTGITGSAYIRGASAALRARLAAPGLEILEAPASLAEILPRASLLIHHGGVGLSQYALSAGRPQVLFPRHMEQLLTAQLVQQLGVGEYLAGVFSAVAVTRKVQQVGEDGRYADRARAQAESVRARGPWDPLERILDACCKIGC